MGLGGRVMSVGEKTYYQDCAEERKKMQSEGTMPLWMTTNAWVMFKQKYLFNADTYKEQIERISKTLSNYTDEPKKWNDKFFNLMWNGWLSPSTPVLSNCGTDRGMAVACSGSVVDDSVAGFFDAYKEIAMLSKNGFGTSAHISDIRCRGTDFGGGDGKADGVVPVVAMLTQTIRQIRQNSRRGAGAWQIDIEHGDFYELCDYMVNNPDDLNIAWIIKDSFIEKLKNGDKEATDRYKRSLKVKVVTGKGYYIFIDKANKLTTEALKNSGLPIIASNLCIAGDQRVVSNYGYLTAKELHDLDVELELFDGQKSVSSSRMKLREKDVDTYKVTLDNGMELTATDYHEFPVAIAGEEVLINTPLKELTIGDRVAIQVKKGLFGNKSMKDEAFLLGQYQSDGTQNKEYIHLCLWEKDFDLKEEIQSKFDKIHKNYCSSLKKNIYDAKFIESNTGCSDVRKISLVSKTLKKVLNFEKGYIPDWIWESDEETQWEYVRGLLYADGTVFKSKSKGNPVQLSYADIKIDFLKQLQLLFNNLGLQSSIRILQEAGKSLLPDGKGGHKYYDTKDCYRLIVGNKNDCLKIEENTGFLSRKGVDIENRIYRDNSKKFHKVSSIEFVGKQDVYCPTVDSDEHIFISQGMKTYNCTEIFLPQSEEYTFSCVLSSMNLSRYDEWKDTDAVFEATVFLDCVAQDLIEKARIKLD